MPYRLKIFVLATLAVLLSLVLASGFAVSALKPGPAGKIVIATGGSEGAFDELAKVYQKELARYGVSLELRPDVQGAEALKGLLPEFKSDFKTYNDANADIQAAFMKGGFASSMQGRYASEKQQVWHERLETNLRSVGRLFNEPLWIFVRADEPAKSLRDFKGKKISIGAAGSGTGSVSRHILKANGIDAKDSTLIEGTFPDDGTPLLTRETDAAMMFLPAESPKVQALLRNRALKLLDFTSEADAYLIRFPALTKVVLRQGSVELNPDIPSADVTLLATSVALVVRANLDPSLEALLAHAVIANPKSGFDKTGEPILFAKPGEFPTASDPEYAISPSVRQLYKTGELPALLQSTSLSLAQYGLPFWPAAFLHEHGSQAVLLIIPALSILVPLFHYLPILYRWGIRRRLLNRYRQLKSLEASIDAAPSNALVAEKLRELDRIEAAVSGISVPLPFTDQLYDLRGHIDLVRHRLETMIQPPGLVAGR